jgi:predicted RND superfamily exporter protein
VTGVLSLATVLDPDGRIAALPADAAARTFAAKLDLIAASPQAELLKGFWNRDQGLARVLVRLYEQQPAPDKQAVFRQAVASARERFGPKCYLTGLSSQMTRTTEAVIVTQWDTFAWSALGILVMLTIALRSGVLALLAILPTMLAVGLVLGLMGWIGVKLDMATALVASVALGLSVDDTFHCLLQFRRERRTRPFAESLFDSYRVTGPGVVLSSLAVAAGFAALRLSEFAPFANFGTMVGIATGGSTLGNLVLLPACLALLERLPRRRAPKADIAPAREVADGVAPGHASG